MTRPDPLPGPARPAVGAGPLVGLELAIFDKDGTLIEFHRMWSGWVAELGRRLGAAAGRPLTGVVARTMGVEPGSGRVHPHAPIAATPMARLREALERDLVAEGLAPTAARAAVAAAWHAPDPVELSRPLADLPALFGALRSNGTLVAIATSDDRAPTERTLAHLGIAAAVAALACADDGRPVKPDPAAVRSICDRLGIAPARTAVVGDATADLAMGRAAGAGLVVGVLTGVGDRAALEPLADLVVDSVADLVPGVTRRLRGGA